MMNRFAVGDNVGRRRRRRRRRKTKTTIKGEEEKEEENPPQQSGQGRERRTDKRFKSGAQKIFFFCFTCFKGKRVLIFNY